MKPAVALAAELARMPLLVERLLSAHVAGPDGRCVGCPSALWVAPHWPCRIAAVAALARDLPARPAQPSLVTSSVPSSTTNSADAAISSRFDNQPERPSAVTRVELSRSSSVMPRNGMNAAPSTP